MLGWGTTILDNTLMLNLFQVTTSFMNIGKMDDLTIWYHVFLGIQTASVPQTIPVEEFPERFGWRKRCVYFEECYANNS